MKSGPLTLAAGCGLLVPTSLGIFLTGVPTILCPCPILTALPALVLVSSNLYWVAPLLPVLLFFAWNPGLFRGQEHVPKRSFVLLIVATALSVIWFVGGWKYGLEYQGRQHTYTICAINSAWLLVLWIKFIRRWRGVSFAENLWLHWMLFAWLAWYAFPYLGELP